MMAEIIFWARDKVKPWDAELDAQAYKRGDVISIHPDGWAWSQRELTNPDWRILRLTSITDLADLEDLRRPENDSGGLLKRKRSRFVDPSKLPAQVQTWLNDDARAVPIFTSNVNRNTVLSYITLKTPRALGQIVFG